MFLNIETDHKIHVVYNPRSRFWYRAFKAFYLKNFNS